MPLNIYEQETRPTDGGQAEQIIVQSARAQTNALLNTLNTFNQTIGAATQLGHALDVRQEELKIKKASEDATAALAKGDFTLRDGLKDDSATLKFNEIVGEGARTVIENEARGTLSGLALSNSNDVQSFNVGAGEYISKLVSDANLPPKNAAALRVSLEGQARGLATQIQNTQTRQDQEAVKANKIANMTNLLDDIATNARAGNTEVAVTMYTDLAIKTEALVQSGEMTGSQRINILKQSESRMNVNAMLGTFDEEMEMGVGNAEKFLEEFEAEIKRGTDSELLADLDAEERDALKVRFRSEINRVKAEEARAITAKAAKNKDLLIFLEQHAEVQTAIVSGEPLDYKNTEDKKAINAVFNHTTPDWSLANPAQQDAAIEFSASTGVVPEKVISKVRTAMFAGNPDAVIAGAELMNKMLEKNPALAEQFAAKDRAFALGVTRLNDAGVPLDQAIQQTKTFQQHDIQARQKTILNSYRPGELGDVVNKQLTSFIDTAYDPGVLQAQPETTLAIKSDYDFLFKQNLALTGNEDDAAEMTNTSLKNKYGVTFTETGEPTIMAYSPEMVIGKSVEPVKWISEDWAATKEEIVKDLQGRVAGGFNLIDVEADLKAKRLELSKFSRARGGTLAGEGKRLKGEVEDLEKRKNQLSERLPNYEVKIVADQQTIRTNNPSWRVFYKDQYGAWKPYVSEQGMRAWRPDYKSSSVYKERQAEKKALVESARKEEKLRADLKELQEANPIFADSFAGQL